MDCFGRGLSWVVRALVVIGLITLAPGATAEFTGQLGSDSATVFGTGPEGLSELAQEQFGAVGAAAVGPWSIFASTSSCNDAPPGAGSTDVFCGRATVRCEGNPDPAGRGPAVNLWRALVDDAGNPVDAAMNSIAALNWTPAGFTCFPQLVPGAANTLTMDMIEREFHDTAFAVPEVSVQPVGNVTLVNLPTYYELVFPTEGFAPGEVDVTTLVGRAVEIRPVFDSANYVYGDGAQSGATVAFGGRYPSGDVVHTYRQPVDAAVRVDVTYGGQFRVDGGEWIDIAGTVTVQGAPQTLRVAEARARLYSN